MRQKPPGEEKSYQQSRNLSDLLTGLGEGGNALIDIIPEADAEL